VYFDIAAARRAGELFAGMFLVRDPRGAHAYEFASQILRAGDYDQERTVMDALATGRLEINQRPVSELAGPPAELRIGLADLSRLPDVLVVRSWQEADAQCELRGYPRSHLARWYPSRSLQPFAPAARRDLIVVWAPEYSGAQTAIHTFALHDAHFEVVVVCRDGSGFSQRAKYINADSPVVPSVLSRALCVIDVSLDDPGWTQALAARGLSVAACSSSGAREVADGIALYDPWSYKSMWSATMQALSRRTSTARESPPEPRVIVQALQNARPATPAGEPLVSVVIPTYNRRDELIRILRKLQEQTYKNFEALVVNDGGQSVADVAAIDSRITVFDREENVGIFGALNFGIEHARGEYIQAEADDDELYPDHLIRLVEALERTGAGVAHSNVMIRYETTRDGRFETNGYNSSIFCCPIDRTEVYASSPVAGNAMIVRRSVFERVGAFDTRFVLGDQEVQIRLAEASDFVYIPHVTAEWLVRDTGQQFSRKKQSDVVADLRAVYERHPAPGPRYVAAVREETLKRIAARKPGIVFPPTISRGPAPSS
jgi:hypothetical protein